MFEIPRVLLDSMVQVPLDVAVVCLLAAFFVGVMAGDNLSSCINFGFTVKPQQITSAIQRL